MLTRTLTRAFRRRHRSRRGQALTEFSLVFPLFISLLVGTIVLGMGIFFHQQVTNAAREAARYAAVHSATSRCPTVSNLPPDPSLLPAPNSYWECDPPANRWPLMAAHMHEKVFAIRADGVRMTACWSGYWTKDSELDWAAYDQIAVDPVTFLANDFRECTVRVFGWTPSQDPDVDASALHVINPRTGLDATSSEKIGIDCSKEFPVTTATDDMSSSYAASNADNANQVTVLACYAWSPPLAGFLLIPETVTLTAVLSEALEYQQ